MFKNYLENVIPWTFALNHTNYSRWLPIYLKSPKELHLIHPTVFEEFQKGFFTVSKTNRLFSWISNDYAHKQNNKLIKSDGGMVGILDHAKTLPKRMISRPVIDSVIAKVNVGITNAKNHHENNQQFEQRFQKNVTDLFQEFLTQSNPFEERDDILCTVVIKVTMTQEKEDSVQRASIIGDNQYKKFLLSSNVKTSTMLSKRIIQQFSK